MRARRLVALLLLAACKEPDCVQACEPSEVERLLAQMTLPEKVFEMHGTEVTDGLWLAGGNEALGIPAFAMSDGARGVTAGHATTFPVGMARGATFDPDLERQVGEAIALELRAKGGNVILAPVVEVLRHPAWGRAQETYGEDPHHVGAMGAAFVRGVQANGAIATPKHFAVNSIEDTRFEVDVTIDERSLQELYLTPYTDVIDAGAVAIMSAYNSVNGDFCAENPVLLDEILRGQLGFEGFVMSDWVWGTHDTYGMAEAGLDLEMPYAQFYGDPLLDAVQAGEIDAAVVDRSVARILEAKLDHLDPTPVDEAVVESAAHVALALQVALESMVLLKNEAALPLSDAASVAVIGPLAAVANLGDEGSSSTSPTTVVTPLAGVEAAAAAHDATVTLVSDPADTTSHDAVVVVVGLTSEDEGEQIPFRPGGDRDDLGLHPQDVALIGQVVANNPRTIVVIEAGSAIRVDPWVDDVPGLVMAWYPGMQGGTALGRLLFGDANFTGRLPLSIPVADADLPPFDHTSDAVTYDYWHGYRHLDHTGTTPRYPFGYGLAYTTFAYAGLSASAGADGVEVEVTVTNTGSVRGAEVVQVYLGTTDIPDRAPRDLKAFRKVWLDPGAAETVALSVPYDDLRHWDDGWRLADATWTVAVGPDPTRLPLSRTVHVTP